MIADDPSEAVESALHTKYGLVDELEIGPCIGHVMYEKQDGTIWILCRSCVCRQAVVYFLPLAALL
jgi:hypothetical protein